MSVPIKSTSKVRALGNPTPVGNEATETAPSIFTGKTASLGSLTNVSKEEAPEAIGHAVVAALRKSTVNVLEACKLVSWAYRKFAADERSLTRFGEVLVSERVIDNFRLGAGGESKLSMLKKVGDNAELLTSPEIVRYADGGYSVLYQVARLLEALGGDEQKLHDFLAAHPGRLSRERLMEEIKQLEAVSNRTKPAAAAGDDAAQDVVNLDSVIAASRSIEFLLVTPTADDIRRIAHDYADHDTLRRCLRVDEAIAKNAVVAVMTVLKDLPTVIGKLLPICGFGSVSQVLLAEAIKGPDLTGARIIVTAERGAGQMIKAINTWDVGGKLAEDPMVLAAKLAPTATGRMHIFAPQPLDDWDCVLGPDAWLEQPSLRHE